MPYEMSQDEIDMINEQAAIEEEENPNYGAIRKPRPGYTCSACGATHKTPYPTSCHTCGHVTGLDR